jgi:hypothetical protein
MANGDDHRNEHPACSHEEPWPPEYRNGANDPKDPKRYVSAAHDTHPTNPPSVPTTIPRRSNTSAPTDPTPAARLLRRTTRAAWPPIGFDLLVRAPVECRGPDESLNEGFDDVVPFTLAGSFRPRVDSQFGR